MGTPNRNRNFANSVFQVRDLSVSTQTSWRIWPIHLSCSLKYQHISSGAGGIGSSLGIPTVVMSLHWFLRESQPFCKQIPYERKRSPFVPAVLGGGGPSIHLHHVAYVLLSLSSTLSMGQLGSWLFEGVWWGFLSCTSPLVCHSWCVPVIGVLVPASLYASMRALIHLLPWLSWLLWSSLEFLDLAVIFHHLALTSRSVVHVPLHPSWHPMASEYVVCLGVGI